MEYNPHYYPHSKYYFAQKQLGYGPLNYVYANRPHRMLSWEWPLCDILNTLPSEYAFRKVRVSSNNYSLGIERRKPSRR